MNNDTEKTKLNFKEGTLSKIIGAVILIAIIVIVIVIKNGKSFTTINIYGAVGGGKEDLLADEEINKAFGSLLSKEFSYIILLNTNNMPLIYEKLIENNYDKNKIYIIEKIEEYKKIVSILKNKKTYILLDNDI